MATGCFFGHKDTPESVTNDLYTAIEKLITEHGVETFYVGNQGHFDFYARAALRQIQKKYPNIRYVVPYRDPVFSIVTVDENGATIHGRSGEFVGITPDAQGVNQAGTSFRRKLVTPITPSQQDRWLPFE
jgi:hypothetical protein